MSLATRCPACGTIFRVVQDQLKVSEGWVRCGQCHEVFHGIEALFDLDSDPAIAARRAARGGAPAAAPSTRVFAENRANAPIPRPEPPAGIVVPSPPPASTPVVATRPIAQTPSPLPMRPSPAPVAGVRTPDNAATPPSGFTPVGGALPAHPVDPPNPSPAIARGAIAPRFAARLAEEAARAQAAPPPSPIPSPFLENEPASTPWTSTEMAPLPSSRGVIPPSVQPPQAPAPQAWQAQAPAPQTWQSPPPAPMPAPSRTIWQSPAAWQAPPAEPGPASGQPPASSPDAWPSPAVAPAPGPWPSPAPPTAPAAWLAPTPEPAPPAAWEPQPLQPAPWQPAAPVPAAPAPTIWESPMGAPAPMRPSFNAPTEPMPLDELPAPFAAPATTPAIASPPAPAAPAPTPPSEPSASELADSFAAAPPVRQPRTITPKASDEPVVRKAGKSAAPAPVPQVPAPDIGGSTLPSRLADDAADEDNRAGPPTLASMLPEDAGEWPPRKKSRKAKAKTVPAKAEANAGAEAETDVETPGRTDPRFLREARSDARWRKPWVRATLGVSLTLLVLAAVAQLAWPQRDTLAARWPETMPIWTWLCDQADCKIEPPRAIASLALDGSSLNRTDTEHVLLFSADLHNRADHEVRMPSFDLTFMDINGAIVSRKVLSPAQIGIRQTALAPDAELHVHARIQVGTLDASGFQAEMFYP